MSASRAWDLACKHLDQEARDHAWRIYERVKVDDHRGVLALLHDLCEDAGISLDTIEADFGRRVRDDIDALTRRDGETYREFVERIAVASDDARAVKMADNLDNLTRPPTKPIAASLRLRWARSLVRLLEVEAAKDPR